MKIVKIIAVTKCLVAQSCWNPDSKDSTFNNKYIKVTSDTLNESTIEFSYWKDKSNADCFLVSKKDTIDRYEYTSRDEYRNYLYIDKKGAIYKLKQFVAFGNEFKLNEIVHFNDEGAVNNKTSFYLKTERLNDSVKISAFPVDYFNKIRVLIGNEDSFNNQKWIKADTLQSLKNYIILSVKYARRKCLLQAIKTDELGADESGKDFYFDIDNLICREIKKTLVCQH
jgi:hypothetical protein